jgi:Galactose oxidase, central domain
VSPPARVNASMAYDAARDKLVLFGGTGEHETRENGLQLNDTWTWDGTTWTKQQPRTSPPAREGASMAYDAATRTVVLFGGVSGNNNNRVTTYLNDTWLWNGSTWVQAHPATAPGPRTGASMAYDGARRKLVLFGGGHGVQLNDTWAWDGSTWTRQHPATSPPARVYAASAYDDGARVVVLSGGVNIVGLTDTWTWDGTTWTKQHPVTAPAAGHAVRMAYDAAQHSMVLISTL